MKKGKVEKIELIKISFKLIDHYGWINFTLEKLAKKKSMDLKNLKLIFRSKVQILIDFSKLIDEQVQKNIDIEELKENDVKDNLFELLMMRFEKLNPYKKTLRVLVNDLRYDPVSLKIFSKKIFETMDFYMELSNAKSTYVLDVVKSNVFFLIYLYCFQIWLKDNTKEMSPTMAEVDKLLTYAETYTKKINLFL